MPALHLGRWTPGRTNLLLLVLQIALTVQAASRGTDYVLPRPPGPLPRSLTVVEASLPLWVWGVGFLLAAAPVMIGMAGGWWQPMMAGHACLAALYTGFSVGMIQAAPDVQWLQAALGAAVLAGGLWLTVTRWRRREPLRFTLAVLAVGAGGWVCATGLGYDFRTATGLMVAGLGHGAFAVGMAWVRTVAPGRGLDR